MPTEAFLPTSAKEMQALGWEQADVILFTGDAYIDHPAFGAAVLGRVLQARGYRVAIVPQPNWRDDLRDFRKLGAPRLFFGITAGAMDSMVNHYTAARRLRHDDAYTPGGRHGQRPDYPTIVYADILRRLYPDTPIVAGGIEASMRRLSHYDYWQDRLRPSILADTRADILVYGMGEKPIVEIAERIERGEPLHDIRQTAMMVAAADIPTASDEHIVLNSYDACLRDKRAQAANFAHIERQSNIYDGGATLWQEYPGGRAVRVNPMHPPMSTAELDAVYDLPYTRLLHPRYRGKEIPAYEMIRHSVCLHRGCFGGCAFCTISAHQGKHIASRSEASVLREARQVTQMPDFRGYLSDLGGPSANMYMMHGRDMALCRRCRRPSCLHPSVCPNLNTDHGPLLKLYRRVDALPGIKKTFIGSGVRYDLSMHATGDEAIDRNNAAYNRELIAHHVSGRLKVAPEHTSDHVLQLMRKPSFALYRRFSQLFDEVNHREGLRQQLVPYFISSHPGCREEDMAQLAADTRTLGLRLEQVQDFTPTPMSLATEIYYTGYHPYTLEPVYTPRSDADKQRQRRWFFWYLPENRRFVEERLRALHRPDLRQRLFAPIRPRKA